MKFPWPLRYTIPGVIFLLCSLLSGASFIYDHQLAVQQLELVAGRHMHFIGNQISSVAAYLMSKNDLAGLRTQISTLGADPILRMAAVCDERGHIMVSSRYEYSGSELRTSPLAHARPRIRGLRHAAILFSEDHNSLLGIFPFLLPPKEGGLVSSGMGYLLLDFDLAYPRSQVMKAFIQRSALGTAALVAACLLAWCFFHRVLNLRISVLADATERLARGEAAEPVKLRGSDELVKLASAFNEMAGKIISSTSGLRKANERMSAEIRERSFVEEALRNSERRFRSIWESSLEAMRLTDSKGAVLAVNAAFCKLVERSAAELIEQSHLNIYQAGEIELEGYPELFETRNIERNQQKRLVLASGRAADLEVSYSFVELERDRPLLLAIFRDVTERKREEEQRLALERKLLDAQKLESLGVLAGGIAHDFNNLLAAILGNTNLAQMQIASSSPAAAYLKNAEKASMRAADLCRQMLAYSGKGRFSMHFVDLNEVVRETLELLEVSITKKAALRVELRPGMAGVFADPAQIRQVIMNLVINASEAIGDTTGLIRIRTGTVQADTDFFRSACISGELPSGDYVYVEVTDSGCGMSPETQARIFEPFFTTKFTGRGLGLAAVLGIVRGHNGALKISSELGKGSAFKFLLPSVTPALPSSSSGSRSGAKLDWKGEGTILVVDDDPTVRAVTARMVEACGFDVLQAVDGLHGVEVFSQKQDRIQAVVLDMTMPKLNGREALVEMRRLRPEVKVLMVSGFSENFSDEALDSTAPDAFLQKPFKPDELKSQLKGIFTAPRSRNSPAHLQLS